MAGYTSVEDAIGMVGRTVNLVGIVVEFTLPRQTQGTDFGCKVRILDPSHQDHVLTIQFFANSATRLPQVRSYHDIICVRNVKIANFQEHVFVIFHKKKSSFFLFEGRSRGIHYQISPSFRRISNEENQLIANLQALLDGYLPFFGANKFTRQLKEVELEEMGDLICKVISVCEIHEGWILFVWDGTDCPPVNIISSPEHGAALTSLQFEELGRSVLENSPRLGTVFRVIIDKSFEGLYVHLRTIGEWVKLRNITFKVKSGMWYGELAPTSTMRLLAEETTIVKERMREYTIRIEQH